jgi:hypothetical protein
VPLLVDDGFKLSGPLQVSDVPNLALFSAKGQLVIAKIKHRSQLVIAPEGNIEAEQIVRRVATGKRYRRSCACSPTTPRRSSSARARPPSP